MNRNLLLLTTIFTTFLILGCNEDSNPTGSNGDDGNITVNPNHDIALYGRWWTKYDIIPGFDTITYTPSDNVYKEFDETSIIHSGSVYIGWSTQNGIYSYTIDEGSDVYHKDVAYKIHGDTLLTWFSTTTPTEEDRYTVSIKE